MGNSIEVENGERQDLIYVMIGDDVEKYSNFVHQVHLASKERGKQISDIGGRLQHRDINLKEMGVMTWNMQGIQHDIQMLNKIYEDINHQLNTAYNSYKVSVSKESNDKLENSRRKVYDLGTKKSDDNITVDSVLESSNNESSSEKLHEIKLEENKDEFFSVMLNSHCEAGDQTSKIAQVNNLLQLPEDISNANPNEFNAEGAQDNAEVNVDITNIKTDIPDEECSSIFSHRTEVLDIQDLKAEIKNDDQVPDLPSVLTDDVDAFVACNNTLNFDEFSETVDLDAKLDAIQFTSDDDDWLNDLSNSDSESVSDEINEESSTSIHNVKESVVQFNVYNLLSLEIDTTKPCSVIISKKDRDICESYLEQLNNHLEVERLMNLNSITRKRKHNSQSSESSNSGSDRSSIIRVQGKKARKICSSSSSSSSSFEELNECNIDKLLLDFDIEAKELCNDDNFDNALLDNIRDRDSEFSSSTSDDDDEDDYDDVDEDLTVKPTINTTNRIPKRKPISWKQDTLLTSSLSGNKASSSGKKSDSEFINSISLDSDSDLEILKENDQSLDNSNLMETKHKIGRKNIRRLVSDHNLSRSTQLAYTEEKERVNRLNKIKTLATDETEDKEGLCLESEIMVHPKLASRLKKHQVGGVKFMWDCCYESVEAIKNGDGTGCILAHCMGLGKSYQVVTLIHTLFAYKEQTKTRRVLLVCPISTIMNWENEFKIAFDLIGKQDFKIFTISDTERSLKAKDLRLSFWYKSDGVLIMGYECFLSLTRLQKEHINNVLINPGPDLLVCDEGHILKNGKANRTKALMMVNTKRKIILTGTPMQNNLIEYYYMVQIVKPNLLGTYKEYTNRFVNPIMNGQYDNSTELDIKVMKKRSHVLHKLLQGTVQRCEVTELYQYLPAIKDYVLLIPLLDVQRTLYKKAIESFKFNKEKRNLFLHYHLLQMIWTHPILLKNNDKVRQPKLGDVCISLLDDDNIPTEDSSRDVLPHGWWQAIVPDNVDNMVHSAKFQIVFTLLEECIKVGDKLLVFSSSLLELDAIEHLLKHSNVQFLRMDGSTAPDTRQQMCNEFRLKNIPLFLLSQKVGGIGLNLTAANRVVLMDVSWNPSVDLQSVFRIFRFGQTKQCFVYRLCSKGTMEEVLYERSINKQAIAGRVVDELQMNRHYNSEDLLSMYRCKVDPVPQTSVFKVPIDSMLATVLQKHKSLIHSYHDQYRMLENLPEEELGEEEMKVAWDEYNKESEALKAQQNQSEQGILFNTLLPSTLNLNSPIATVYDPNPIVI